MIKRRKSKEISIGNVKIGNNNPISVQSMCNTDTRNIQETAMQIQELANAGCELVRLAVLNKDAAEAPKVKEASNAARTNFFMMELPSVNLMIFGRVCGMG